MWNKPTKKELSKIPKFYATEGVQFQEKMIYMHFFLGGSDWYAAEYDSKNQLFFGFVILNNDYEMAEWGYFSLRELCEISVKSLEVDKDLHFTLTKAEDIRKIKLAQNW